MNYFLSHPVWQHRDLLEFGFFVSIGMTAGSMGLI